VWGLGYQHIEERNEYYRGGGADQTSIGDFPGENRKFVERWKGIVRLLPRSEGFLRHRCALPLVLWRGHGKALAEKKGGDKQKWARLIAVRSQRAPYAAAMPFATMGHRGRRGTVGGENRGKRRKGNCHERKSARGKLSSRKISLGENRTLGGGQAREKERKPAKLVKRGFRRIESFYSKLLQSTAATCFFTETIRRHKARGNRTEKT